MARSMIGYVTSSVEHCAEGVALSKWVVDIHCGAGIGEDAEDLDGETDTGRD
jgi:hypothetical protein